jgi:hypothetical protein
LSERDMMLGIMHCELQWRACNTFFECVFGEC